MRASLLSFVLSLVLKCVLVMWWIRASGIRVAVAVEGERGATRTVSGRLLLCVDRDGDGDAEGEDDPEGL